MQTDYIGLSVGVLGILIGIVVSYYFYRKSLRIKEPSWAIRSNNLIQDYSTKVDNLKIMYKDKPVENLTISRVLFWNNGVETIDNLDLKTANPLRIIGTEQVNILNATVLVSNNTSSQFRVLLGKNKREVTIDFDYLDEKQGAVIQIIHTGKSSQDLKVIGDIKGVKNVQNKFPYPKWAQFINKLIRGAKAKLSRKFVAGFSIVFGIAYILFGTLSYFSFTSGTPDFIRQSQVNNLEADSSQIVGPILITATGFLLMVTGIYLWRLLGIAPKGLEGFLDEFAPK